ncbi:RNA 2'-phosphotransferase [Erwinia phyllosphaerae]|uniref:RNA 2'-phosphotransferase n=1 Tax=Erwinia phyllosphaerae TaxID=2853256 RepID=UPI001FEFC86C|nr:RNA 2'-phosphotransferase [Erwinia phyllosphaerae]MBV4369021.1 RNA 2'-phosphotransferase [Erwinia phyllosphaerae]
MSKKNTDISKFLSYVLRHHPEAIGLSLDQNGWAVITDLILCAKKEGYIFEKSIILAIVTSSDKKRFTISTDGLHIRAAQGHSMQQVKITYKENIPPDILYHGTAARFISEIRKKGLLPMSRQYVHLSTNEVTAIQVGQRHGKPMILIIKALNMYEQGFKFFQAENGVWLTEAIPYQFIQE